MTACPDCGCGPSCAEVGVVCGCCGNFQFLPGDPFVVQTQFYSGALSCAFCGMTWQGTTIDTTYCSDPWRAVTEFRGLGPGIFYRYIGAYSKWYETDDLTTAIQNRTFGTIYDNCGNAVPTT